MGGKNDNSLQGEVIAGLISPCFPTFLDQVGKRNGLPTYAPVDDNGKFTAEAGEDFQGLSVLGEGNTRVIEKLKAEKCLIKQDPYQYVYILGRACVRERANERAISNIRPVQCTIYESGALLQLHGTRKCF